MMVVDDEHWEDGMQEIQLQGFSDIMRRLIEIGADALCSNNIPFPIPWHYAWAVNAAKAIMC